MNHRGTTLMLDDSSGTYEVSVRKEGMSLPELISEVFVPILRAAGYTEATIRKHIKEGA